MSDERDPLSWGLRVIIAFHIFNILLLVVGLAGLFSYDAVSKLGLLEDRASLDPAVLQTNLGITVADCLVPFPLCALAVWGLYHRQFYGAICSWMVFAWSLYWPLVFWMMQFMYQRDNIQHAPVTTAYFVVPTCCWCFAVWGSWYLCRREKVLLSWWRDDWMHRGGYDPIA